jgi:DNA-binding NtrC family response regulator
VTSRVLIVDDDDEVCELISRTLTRAGYQTVTAQSGEAALTVFEAGDIQCLVVDKVLPGMHGAELMAEARRRVPGLPVVLVSGHPEPLSFGAERPEVCLSKPFKSLSTIVDAVGQALLARSTSSPVDSLRERLSQVVSEMGTLRKKRE